MHPYVFSFAGGLLIGAAVWLLLTGLGRVAGISGIMAATIGQPTAGAWRLAFLAGLIGGGLLFALDLCFPRSVLKDATTDTGLVVKVPAFIKTGDVIRVDTRDGSYVERQK